MDDAKNFVLGIFQTVKERFGNPLVSAFAVSWALWNFRLLLVLVGKGDGGWQAKLTHIDTKLMPGWKEWSLNGFVIPLASALVWIYLLPPVLRAIAAFHEGSQNKAREAIFTATEAKTLSVEEALSMRQVMVKQRAEWQADRAETVQSLEGLVKNLEKANEDRKEAAAKEQSLIKEVESLKAKIEELEAPPPIAPFDFKGKPTKEKAAALNLRLLDRKPASPPSIVFDDAVVDWPWVASEASQINLRHPRLLSFPLDEDTVWGMFYLLNMHRGGSPRQNRAEWATWFAAGGAKNPDALLNKLWQHSIFSGSSHSPEFTELRSIYWLQEIGFHYYIPPNDDRPPVSEGAVK